MVSPALVFVAREGRIEAGAAVFLLGGISSDQIVPEAGMKTLVGYREMDEDREPFRREFFREISEDVKILKI
jgi:hypothetical protein